MPFICLNPFYLYFQFINFARVNHYDVKHAYIARGSSQLMYPSLITKIKRRMQTCSVQFHPRKASTGKKHFMEKNTWDLLFSTKQRDISCKPKFNFSASSIQNWKQQKLQNHLQHKQGQQQPAMPPPMGTPQAPSKQRWDPKQAKISSD